MSCSAWSASSHVAGQSLSFPENGEDCGEEAPLFFTPYHCAQHPWCHSSGHIWGRTTHIRHWQGKLFAAHLLSLWQQTGQAQGILRNFKLLFLGPQCCPQPSVVSAIILASKAPKCPKWQSASSKKDWRWEPQLLCPAWKGQSQFWRWDR